MNNTLPTQIAVIREAECIGCTKCIQACPTDAIIGASKLMHTIISDACTGCGLCMAPCPVDCIDWLFMPPPSDAEKQATAKRWANRQEKHQARLLREKIQDNDQLPIQTLTERKIVISDAVARVKEKKRKNRACYEST